MAKMKRKLIFLMGYTNVGKDTVADLIKKVSIEPVESVAFADAVKTECYPALGKEYTPETDDREWREAHRSEIIAYGEGQKREHGMFYWVEKALNPILLEKDLSTAKEKDLPHIIVTDCRRVEEVMWYKTFKMRGAAKVRNIYDPVLYVVHREGAEKEDKDYLTHVALQYAAETRAFDKMIKNYETLDKLELFIKDLYAVSIR
jgi:hypothetical protein